MTIIYQSVEVIPEAHQNSVVAIGNFDGVHIGHQELIKTAKAIAKELGLPCSVLTFAPHPEEFFARNAYQPLKSYEDKLKMLEGQSIDAVFVENFDANFACLTSEQFIKKILQEKYQVAHVVTGYNFYFGAKRSGDTKTLAEAAKNLEFGYSKINQVMLNNFEVSTSEIKQMLSTGRVNLVAKMLGRNFYLEGTVVRGRNLASQTLSFPTANINLSHGLCLPLFGVYLVKVSLNNQKYYGIANLGIKPTVETNPDMPPCLEVHIFDFNADLYGVILKVEFIQFIRPEQKFSSIAQLKEQILRDVNAAQYSAKNSAYHYQVAE